MYSSSDSKQDKIETVITGGTLGNFMVYGKTQFSASHLLSLLWTEAHLDGKTEAHSPQGQSHIHT